MPDLGQFAQLAERAGVPPVPLANFRGGTADSSTTTAHSQVVEPRLPPIPPVPPRNNNAGGGDCWRDQFEERAAILEYDAGYARAEAERLARAFVKEEARARVTQARVPAHRTHS